ncbi:hypothetical protein [uncultured Methanobrevibacter sp.]|uniref:hypothetical protein n=1 Tax=uncultured Methanobrevibacter sp. TaxID=253161 RepID=UPI0025D90843|nr:hypothetical protein [uncultured Methanobrevibacter sp.]
MIINIISSIIELENNTCPSLELDTVLNEVLTIVKWEIKKSYPGFDFISYYDGDYPTIEIISKEIHATDLYIKLTIDSAKNGYYIRLNHDWLKFKDITKFVGEDIIRTLSENIRKTPEGFIKLSNYYGSSSWDDIKEVYLLSRFFNINHTVDIELISSINELIEIYIDLLIDYESLESYSIIEDIHEIFKLYPREKENFQYNPLRYEIITYMKYDLYETILRKYNELPDDLKVSITRSNDEYALSPDLSYTLNQFSTSIFYRDGLILGMTFECSDETIKFYISQDLDRINSPQEGAKIGKTLISAIGKMSNELDFEEIEKTEIKHLVDNNKSYDIYRFHWICSKRIKIDELDDEELIEEFDKFKSIYDKISEDYKYLRSFYDEFEINKNYSDNREEF